MRFDRVLAFLFIALLALVAISIVVNSLPVLEREITGWFDGR